MKAACAAFLDGYRSVRPLLPEEKNALPASVKARDFWETGCWLEFDKNVDPAVVRKGLHSLAAQFRRFPFRNRSKVRIWCELRAVVDSERLVPLK